MKKLSARAYFLKKTFDFFIVGLLIVFLLFMWTLYRGPISVPYLKPYIVQALNYDEEEYDIEIKDVNLELVRSIQPLRITAKNISFKKKDGTMAIQAPKLYLSFSLRALIKGMIAPSDISLERPTVYMFASYGVAEENINEVNKKKLEFYVNKFKEFLSNYNSEDKIYPESFVNNITIKNGEFELHEVDLGRKWVLSDVAFEFSRNLINLEVNANALVNINEKIASAGFEGVYHAADDELDLEVYFSDLILSDLMSTFNETTEDNILSSMSVEVPINGKINTKIMLRDILNNPQEAGDYLNTSIEKIDFEFDSGHGIISFAGDAKYNYEIDDMQVKGNIVGGIDEINIAEAEFKLGGQDATFSLRASGFETYYLEHSLKDSSVRFNVEVKEFSLQNLSKFWPRYLAEPAWQWCKEGLPDGIAKNAKFTFDFGYNNKTSTWGLLNLNGVAELNDVDIYYLDGMPMVRDVYGTAKFTAKNISIDIDKGISDGVIITGGNVNIYDLDKEDNYISIKLIGNSAVKDAIELINHPPLEFATEAGIDFENIKGTVDIELKLDFELRNDIKGKDIKTDVKAVLHDIEIENIFANHDIKAENIALNVNSKGWNLNGQAEFNKIPLTISMNENFSVKKNKSKYHISFKLDDSSKKILGIDWKILSAPNMTGFAVINADVEGDDDNMDINICADLQQMELNYAYLGFVKPKGDAAQAKAHLIWKNGKVADIPAIGITKSDFEIGGNIKIYNSGRVQLIDIDKIKGPKTSARAKINLSDADNAKIKVDVTGNSFDLISMFDKTNEEDTSDGVKQGLLENEDDGLEKINDTDIFISVSSLWTNKTTPIQNFAGSAKLKRGIGIDEVHMVGNYGIDKSIKLNLDYVPRDNKEHYLSIDSNNAGSTLKVLRLYDNMVGKLILM